MEDSDLQDERYQVANRVFLDYNFGNHILITHTGWEKINTDVWTSKIFLEHENFAIMRIQFEPNSVKTIKVLVNYER